MVAQLNLLLRLNAESGNVVRNFKRIETSVSQLCKTTDKAETSITNLSAATATLQKQFDEKGFADTINRMARDLAHASDGAASLADNFGKFLAMSKEDIDIITKLGTILSAAGFGATVGATAGRSFGPYGMVASMLASALVSGAGAYAAIEGLTQSSTNQLGKEPSAISDVISGGSGVLFNKGGLSQGLQSVQNDLAKRITGSSLPLFNFADEERPQEEEDLGFLDRLADHIKKLEEEFDYIGQGFDSLINGMTTSLTNFITSGKLNFKDFASSIISDLVRIAAQAAVLELFKGLFGALGFGGSTVESAQGNVFDKGAVVPFRRGGILRRPTLFPLGLAGEAGPEAILPLTRLSNGNLGVASNGGAPSMAIHIDARGAQAGVEQHIRRVLAEEMPRIISQASSAGAQRVAQLAGRGGTYARQVGRR